MLSCCEYAKMPAVLFGAYVLVVSSRQCSPTWTVVVVVVVVILIRVMLPCRFGVFISAGHKNDCVTAPP